MDRDALDQQLLKAHADADLVALQRLYTLAGDEFEAEGDIDGACFFLTHAYIFALQAGSETALELNRRLWVHGREERYAPTDPKHMQGTRS